MKREQKELKECHRVSEMLTGILIQAQVPLKSIFIESQYMFCCLVQAMLIYEFERKALCLSTMLRCCKIV